MEFIENPNEVSSINTENFTDVQEWKIFDHVEVNLREGSKHPAITFTCHAGRQ